MPNATSKLHLPLVLALLAPVLASPSSARALENRVRGQKSANPEVIGAKADVSPGACRGNRDSRTDLTSGCHIAPRVAESMSRVLPASRLAELGAEEGTVVLGHYTRPIVAGGRTFVQETLPILEDAAKQLGGRTLTSLPADIGAIAPELQSASRIIFYTSPNMQGLTAAEMALIQSDPALVAKTVFIYGGF